MPRPSSLFNHRRRAMGNRRQYPSAKIHKIVWRFRRLLFRARIRRQATSWNEHVRGGARRIVVTAIMGKGRIIVRYPARQSGMDIAILTPGRIWQFRELSPAGTRRIPGCADADRRSRKITDTRIRPFQRNLEARPVSRIKPRHGGNRLPNPICYPGMKIKGICRPRLIYDFQNYVARARDSA